MSSQVNPQLCKACNTFFSQVSKVGNPPTIWHFRGGRWENERQPKAELQVLPHHSSFDDFQQSAAKGCHMCDLFRLQLSERERLAMHSLNVERGNVQGLIAIQRYKIAEQARYQVALTYPMPGDMITARGVKGVFLNLHLQPTAEKICVSESFLSEPNSLPHSSWEVALNWISACVEGHPECRQTYMTSRHLPSRVIEVGDQEDFSDVHLCSRSEIGEDFQYATLSHCWGPKGLSFKLLDSRMTEFSTRIPWEGMPLTFKHAIIATRRLKKRFGIKYIWIDALCIIQDSNEDWTLEAEVMGEIYMSSFCNLTASVGPDGNSGLFHLRDPMFLHTCIITIDPPSLIQGRYKLDNVACLETEVESAVLSSRGWVLQEFVLSPRLVHFTPQGLFWECAALCAQEKHPRETIPGLITRTKKNTFVSPVVVSCSEGSLDRDYQIYRVWMNIVREYTTRQLTIPSDRLVAISGLAKQMQQMLGDRDSYLCGLWTRHLLLYMLWSVSHGHQKQRPKPYSAPSWSWASVEGRSYNHRTNRDAVEHTSPLASLGKPEITYSQKNKFGTVQSASMRVTGNILKVKIGKRWGLNLAIAYLEWQGTRISSYPVSLDLSTPGDSLLSAYCLPLVMEAFDGAEERLVGLVLQRVDGEPGRYERFGVFSLAMSFLSMRGPRSFRTLIMWSLGTMDR